LIEEQSAGIKHSSTKIKQAIKEKTKNYSCRKTYKATVERLQRNKMVFRKNYNIYQRDRMEKISNLVVTSVFTSHQSERMQF